MRRPGKLTRREVWRANAVYRWTVSARALRRFRYRHLGGPCYQCPGRYGQHKFSCSVGMRERDLQR